MLPPKHIETLAVHAGRHIDPLTGAITAPIHLSTTFERAADGEYPTGFSYSREGNPNRQALEECLTALEGGKEGLAFASGMAVLNAVLQSLEPGLRVVLVEGAVERVKIVNQLGRDMRGYMQRQPVAKSGSAQPHYCRRQPSRQRPESLRPASLERR